MHSASDSQVEASSSASSRAPSKAGTGRSTGPLRHLESAAKSQERGEGGALTGLDTDQSFTVHPRVRRAAAHAVVGVVRLMRTLQVGAPRSCPPRAREERWRGLRSRLRSLGARRLRAACKREALAWLPSRWPGQRRSWLSGVASVVARCAEARSADHDGRRHCCPGLLEPVRPGDQPSDGSPRRDSRAEDGGRFRGRAQPRAGRQWRWSQTSPGHAGSMRRATSTLGARPNVRVSM